MKRVFKLIGYFVTVCCLMAGVTVYAAEDVVIDIVSVDPPEMSSAGNVTITFELSNHSEQELTSLSVSLGETVFEFENSIAIPPTGSAILPISLPLTLSQLDTPLVFTVKWISDGSPYYATVETKVTKIVDPTIELTRKVSEKHARTGQQVTVTYVLKNPTKFDMTEVTLIDEQISNEPIRKNDILRANGSLSIDFSFVMAMSDITSMPVVTYLVNDRTKSFSGLKPVTVVYSDISVDISAEKIKSNLDGTTFDVTVRNTGASDVFGIIVTDGEGTQIHPEPFDLKAGTENTITYTAPPITSNQPKQIYFTFNGKDSFDDPLESKATPVSLISPIYDDSQFSAYLTAEVLTRPVSSNSAAEIKFSIENRSLLPLREVRIVEPSLGEVAYVDSLPSGNTDLIQWISVNPDQDLQFYLEGKDDSGSSHQLATVNLSKEMLEVDIPTDTTEPEPTPEQISDASNGSIWKNFIFRVLVIMVAVMVLACVVLIALKVLEKGVIRDPEDFHKTFFTSEPDEPMEDNQYMNYSNEYPGEAVEESADIPAEMSDRIAERTCTLSEGNAPKHIVLKKQPAKKIQNKKGMKRIG